MGVDQAPAGAPLAAADPGSIAAAQVLHFAWPTETPATVLTVGSEEPDVTPIINTLDDREHDVFLASAEAPTPTEVVDRIVTEANYGYGVIAVGAAARPTVPTARCSTVDTSIICRWTSTTTTRSTSCGNVSSTSEPATAR